MPIFAEPVVSLRASSDDALWIGTEKGVTLLPGGPEGRNSAQSFTSVDGLARGPVTTLFEAADGAMWFGTNGGGVSRINRHDSAGPAQNAQPPNNPQFTTFTTADGLNSVTVNGIAQDSEGAMWFAGGPRNEIGIAGLSRYDGTSFVNFSRADGFGGELTYGVHVDQHGGLWATSVFGVSHYDYRSLTLFGEGEGLDPGAVWNIVSTSDGNVWFQVDSGPAKLSRFDGAKLVKLTRDDGLPGANPADIYLDRDGALLVSDWEAGRSVARFNPGSTVGERIRFELLEGSGRVLGGE